MVIITHAHTHIYTHKKPFSGCLSVYVTNSQRT